MTLEQQTPYIMDTTKIEIKRIANGLVLELGSHVVGWETVFFAKDAEEAKKIINSYIDVQTDKANKKPQPKEVAKHTPQLMMEKLNNQL